MVAVSCNKEKLEEYGTYSFAAQIVPDSKAHANDGKGDHVNRCIMEIYYNGQKCDRQVSPVVDKSASFTSTLALHRTYRIVFWADCGESDLSDLYYMSTSLTEIGIVQPYHGSNDAMDAFCFSAQYSTNEDTPALSDIELLRPFAQINFSKLGYTGPGVAVSFSVPLTYNVRDDLIGIATGVSYTNAGLYSADPQVLSMDYIFAPETDSRIDITIDGITYTDIPIKRNIRTNITIE